MESEIEAKDIRNEPGMIWPLRDYLNHTSHFSLCHQASFL